MDELDAGILRELQQNARLSNRELASRLGLAPSTFWFAPACCASRAS